jgi:uncharacterized protein (DUF362 family)
MKDIEVAVVKIPEEYRDDDSVLKDKLETLINIAGELDFIRYGDSVLVKICMNSDRPYPATTCPKTLATLIDIIAKKRPSAIYVGEKTAFFRNTKKNFKKTGIAKKVDELRQIHEDINIKLISFDDYIYRERYFPNDIKENWEISPGNYFIRAPKMLFEDDPFLMQNELPPKVDHIIVLGTVKTHFLGRFTLGMKSYVGFLDTESRHALHKIPKIKNIKLKNLKLPDKIGLQERIPELFLVMPHPKLVILDGRELIITGGPDSNNRFQPLPSLRANPYSGVILAGSDIVATDAAGVALLKTQKGISKEISNSSIWEMPTFKRAVKLNLGASHEDEIFLHAEQDDEIFDKMAWFLQ